MYHYIRPRDSEVPPGIRPLYVDEFEQQLGWLEERYRILSAGEFLACLTAGWSTEARPPCLLTFDDGVRDHFEVAAPILHKRGLSGLFFVVSWPPELGRMPITHALHWALGVDDEELWIRLQERIDCSNQAFEAEAGRIYAYETPLRGRIKYAVNFVLAAEESEAILCEFAGDRGRTFKGLAREWFMTADELTDMHRAGLTIGVHGCSHQSATKLGLDGIRAELSHCHDWLRRLLGEAPRWYSGPFGGTGISPADLRPYLEAIGIQAAVTTIKGTIAPGADCYALRRVDAIDLPPRKGVSDV